MQSSALKSAQEAAARQIVAEVRRRAGEIPRGLRFCKLVWYSNREQVGGLNVVDLLYGSTEARLNAARALGVQPLMEQLAAAVAPWQLDLQRKPSGVAVGVRRPGAPPPKKSAGLSFEAALAAAADH